MTRKNNRHNSKNPTFFNPHWEMSINPDKLKHLDKAVKREVYDCARIVKEFGNNLAHKKMSPFNFIINTDCHNRFHNHIHDNHNTFILLWQFDKKSKNVYLIDVDSHENFKFNQKFTP